MSFVPVYNWLMPDGNGFGCGTRVEFDYWSAQGVNPQGATLGEIICHEPASRDEQRNGKR